MDHLLKAAFSLEKLKAVLRVSILLAAFSFSVSYAMAQDRMACVKKDIALASIFRSGLGMAGTFISEQGIVMQFFLAPDGRWAWIGITPDMDYCVLMQGTEYSLAVGHDI